MAMAFASPNLPVPEVREVGSTPDGLAYAISVCHRGRFLEDTPVELAGALAPTLTGLLVALRAVPAAPDSPVLWHQPAGSLRSWREFLVAGLVDDPSELVHGWGTALAADPKLAALSGAVSDRVRALVEACPERRDLVHGDLLHGNVLVSVDAERLEAVFSWKCSVRGDFLFDAAWCSFWAPGTRASPPPTLSPGCSPLQSGRPTRVPSSTAPPATTATSSTSALPTSGGTSGPGTRPS